MATLSDYRRSIRHIEAGRALLSYSPNHAHRLIFGGLYARYYLHPLKAEIFWRLNQTKDDIRVYKLLLEKILKNAEKRTIIFGKRWF